MMATSYRDYKDDIKLFLESKFPGDASILDVGAGSGTYYDLLHEHFQNIEAVEVFKPNIENYNLRDKYKHVYNKDIKDFKYKYYDIIIFGDIIEHLTTEEARAVLAYALPRCEETIVAVPYLYPQGIEEDNIYEIHKQDDLTPEVMRKRYPDLELLYGNERYGYYIKRRGINGREDREDKGVFRE